MLDLLADLWRFMRSRKKLWLAPVIILLVLMGVFLVLSQSAFFAPLVYTLF
jgi:hypothetical protein